MKAFGRDFTVFVVVTALYAVSVPCAAMLKEFKEAFPSFFPSDTLSLNDAPALLDTSCLPDIPRFSDSIESIEEWDEAMDRCIRKHALQLEMLLRRETPVLVEIDKSIFRFKCVIIYLASGLLYIVIAHFIMVTRARLHRPERQNAQFIGKRPSGRASMHTFTLTFPT